MKQIKRIITVFLILVLSFALTTSVIAQQINNIVKYDDTRDISKIELYPGGMPFGVKIISNGLTVVKFSESQGKNTSSAYEAGIRVGDIITKVNDSKISSIEDFVKEVDKSGSNNMKITVTRGKDQMEFTVKPKYSKDDGKYKTGIWVKDSTSGIGTVTFIDPNTNIFAGLGHAICDSNTGKIVPLKKGQVLDVSINGVIKGQVGCAGELKGTFKGKKLGSIYKNSACGVFGLVSKDAFDINEEKIFACPKEDITEGEAYVICTLDESGPQKYKINISNIDLTNSNVKNFKISITDKELLDKTGGIVQGMSGSPIIQNGKLIGAVTHVLINDPTCGYGIFIENMLKDSRF